MGIASGGLVRMNITKLEKLKGERPKYAERFDIRAFKSHYPSDLVKGIVEIIKNGVDAYIKEKGENCSKEEIKVILENLNTKNPIVRIVNFAKGMDFEDFEKALDIGADTSGENEGVTGAHGYGMKEAAWAFKQAKIVTINENKYSSRVFYWDSHDSPKYAWDLDARNNVVTDFSVDEHVRKETSIKKEGTYFEAIVPDEISFPRLENLRLQLSENILLRTINQSDKFKLTIECKNTKSGEFISLPIRYIPPEIVSLREDICALELGNFSFEYPKYGLVNCSYEIYLANRELSPTGDTREAGLLICAGPFSVLDCTLFDHGGTIANRFFGKVLLSGPMRQISKNEKILDEKREAGLLKKTDLYKALYKQFHPLLEKLIEKERKRLNKKTTEVREGLIENKIDLIKAFNRIDREETEDSSELEGDIKFTPGPTGIRFCVQDYLKLIERQEKKVHIVIDPNIIPENSEIVLRSNNSGLDINPSSFKLTRADIDKDGIFKKKISFSSAVVDTFSVTAHVADMLNKAEMDVDVVKDRRLYTNNPVEFVPSSDDIVAGKSKNFSLIIDISKINKKDKIILNFNNLFMITKKVDIGEAKKITDDISELMIDVHCLGKPKQKGQINAEIGEHKSILELNIIDSKDRHLRGDFEGIKDDPTEDPQEMGYYENKIINICINHALFRHYRRNTDSENNPLYRVLYGDTIIREFCKTLARKKVKIFSNTGAEEFRVKFNEKFEEIYKKHAVRLHKFCINQENIERLKK